MIGAGVGAVGGTAALVGLGAALSSHAVGPVAKLIGVGSMLAAAPALLPVYRGLNAVSRIHGVESLMRANEGLVGLGALGLYTGLNAAYGGGIGAGIAHLTSKHHKKHAQETSMTSLGEQMKFAAKVSLRGASGSAAIRAKFPAGTRAFSGGSETERRLFRALADDWHANNPGKKRRVQGIRTDVDGRNYPGDELLGADRARNSLNSDYYAEFTNKAPLPVGASRARRSGNMLEQLAAAPDEAAVSDLVDAMPRGTAATWGMRNTKTSQETSMTSLSEQMKFAKHEPFGGKQAPPFGKKGKGEEKKASLSEQMKAASFAGGAAGGLIGGAILESFLRRNPHLLDILGKGTTRKILPRGIAPLTAVLGGGAEYMATRDRNREV
jgi:hypothetical protein